MSLQLISMQAINPLSDIRVQLRRLESRTADQTSLAIIGASIAYIDQAQSIPAALAIKSIELAADCLAHVLHDDVRPMRLTLRGIAHNEHMKL